MRTTEQLRKILKVQCAKEGSVKTWAAKNDFAFQFVYAVINGEKDFTPRMLDILKYKKVETPERYEKIEQ